MGTLDSSSPLMGASGKVGNIIFYNVDGKTHFRQCPDHPCNPRSPKQVLQRNRMLCTQTLFKSVKKCLLYDILNLAADRQKLRSGYHLFLKLNTNAFGEKESIDYSLLNFARGSLQLPFNFRLISSNPQQAEFAWTNNSEQTTARGSDHLMAAAIFPDEPFRVEMLSNINATRQDEHAIIPLDERIKEDIHLYCFFAGSGLKAFSDDRYFCLKR